MPDKRPNPMLSAAQVAEELAIHARTVLNLIYRGDLKAVRVGGQWRIRERDLAMYLTREDSLSPSAAAS